MGILIVIGVSVLLWVISNRISSKNNLLSSNKMIKIIAPKEMKFESLSSINDKLMLFYRGKYKNIILIVDPSTGKTLKEIEILTEDANDNYK